MGSLTVHEQEKSLYVIIDYELKNDLIYYQTDLDVFGSLGHINFEIKYIHSSH